MTTSATMAGGEPATRATVYAQALARARSGQSFANYPAIIAGFLAKGIPEEEILPRENVLTYHAWRALGRQVRKGEHGVRVVTYLKPKVEDDRYGDDPATIRRNTRSRPWWSTVFHISQTDEAKP